jgi:hypothetical protein
MGGLATSRAQWSRCRRSTLQMPPTFADATCSRCAPGAGPLSHAPVPTGRPAGPGFFASPKRTPLVALGGLRAEMQGSNRPR